MVLNDKNREKYRPADCLPGTIGNWLRKNIKFFDVLIWIDMPQKITEPLTE